MLIKVRGVLKRTPFFYYTIIVIGEVIEALNNHIFDKRALNNIKDSSHLVLQWAIFAHETFKAYKTLRMTLWFINGKERCSVLRVEHTAKAVNDSEIEKLKYKTGEIMCHNIFNWISSYYYNQVVEGTYKGYEEGKNEIT